MEDRFDRREVLRWAGVAAIGAAAGACVSAGVHVRSTAAMSGAQTRVTTTESKSGATARAATTGATGPDQVAARFVGQVPTQWGTAVDGVGTRLDATGAVIALTFDACGGPHGSAVDQDLIVLLEREQLPATLFLNQRWMMANPQVTDSLIANPLFEIANHGTHHKPLSTVGKSAYGIVGCASPAEVADEVESNHDRLTALIGHPPRFFRSGTAHYDEVAAEIVSALGETPVSFAINGDAGATYTVVEIGRALAHPPPGAIVLMHMNQPRRATAEGLAAALPALRAKGTTFVTLSGAHLPLVER